jgi:uncharacterized protein (TIGR00297 family)
VDSAPSPSDALIAAALAAGVAWVSFQRRLLSASGAVAAVLIGAAMFASGWIPAALLLLFFFSSALLALLARVPRRSELVLEQAAPRGALQVLAVGMFPALAALVAAFTGDARWWWGMAAALGFATSDTWSTDWGQTAPAGPRLLGFGRELVPGQSGGMTLRGTLGGGVGALFLSGFATVALRGTAGQWLVLATVAWGGSLVDSLLGAVAQWRGQCTVCGRMTERRRHCGARARGERNGLSNEGVNLVGSALCLGLGVWLCR